MTADTKQMDLFNNLSLYEGSDVEYKSGRGGLPRSLWETYSAFANTQGGTIFLGVAQTEDRLDVHGLENAEKLVSDFWNGINNSGKVSRNLLANENVFYVPLPDTKLKVVCIEVPRADRRDRPVFLGSDPFKGTYRRNHEGDYLCREDEVRRMFADQSQESADSLILAGFSLQDLDADSIKQYRNRWASRADHVWLAEDDKGLMEKLGGWRRDRRTNEEGVTVAGLLMFGKTEAITAPEGIPGFHVDYRERLSDDPSIRWTDRLTSDGKWEANVFQFYQRVMLKLSSDSMLKTPFQRNAEGYRSTATAVHEALQEALVNALIHADYRGQGGIVIDRYPDRFEFSNPGTLLVSYEQLVRGSISECRNKSLQRMFQMLGVGDKAGSGIDKIRTSWAAKNWRSPSLKETFRPDRVRLELPLVSMLSDELLQDLRGQFGADVETLSREEIQAVAIAASEGSVSNQRLQEMLPLHRVDITKLLQGLVRNGYLVADGAGRGTRYLPPNPPALGALGETASPLNLPNSPPKDSISPPKDPNSPPYGDTGGADSDPALLEIARPIRESSRTRNTELMDRTILSLCDGRYLTLRDLAGLLDRGASKLRDNYLKRLVERGELELLYPEIPNHKQQAYRKRQK